MPTFLLLSVVNLVAYFVHVAEPPFSSLLSLSLSLSLSTLVIVLHYAYHFNQPLGDWDVSSVENMYESEWCQPSCLSSSLLPTLSMSLTLSLSLHFSQCLHLHLSLIKPWETGMYRV